MVVDLSLISVYPDGLRIVTSFNDKKDSIVRKSGLHLVGTALGEFKLLGLNLSFFWVPQNRVTCCE